MKRNYKLISFIGIFVFAGIIFGCAAEKAEVKNSENKMSAEAGKPSENTNTPEAENAEKEAQKNTTGEIPSFKKSENYKTGVREKMFKAGWKPARSEGDGKENCITDSEVCREFPELEAGPSSPEGAAIFRWSKGGKIALIYTTGEPLVFVRVETQNQPKADTEKSNIAGKYLYKSKHEYGEDTFLWELKSDTTASYKAVMEGNDGADLKGKWSYDATRKIITVTLYAEMNEEEIYKFKFEGNDLKMIEEIREGETYKNFTGKIFKKR